jgi:hypothetical protein
MLNDEIQIKLKMLWIINQNKLKKNIKKNNPGQLGLACQTCDQSHEIRITS